ncbi:C2H2 finger domain-containing protein, partial [Diplocarpon rosae]
MPPSLGEQNAAGPYGSSHDFGTEKGSNSARIYFENSSLAQGGSASMSLENLGGTAHSHPEPSQQYRSLHPSSSGGASASKILSHRPNTSTPQSQSTLSIYGYGPQPLPQKQGSSANRVEVRQDSSMSHSHGHPLNNNNSLRPLSQSQRRNVTTPSRFGYPPKKQKLLQYQWGNLMNEPGDSQENIPSMSKAPLKASANMAHPSHHQQRNLQYSSSPDQEPHATPKSSMQVVIPLHSPVHFYSNSPTPTYSGRGRAANSAILMDCRPLSEPPKKRGRPFINKTPVRKPPKKRGRPFTSVAAELEAAARKAAKAERAAARAACASQSESRGRRPRVRHQVEIAQPEPIFHPFICEWENCFRELQNLETLRLHIHVAHKKRLDGKAQCLWAQCGREEKTLTANTVEGQLLEEGRAAKNNARRFRKQRGANAWAIKELKLPKQLQGMAMAPPILASSDDDDDDSGIGADGGEDGLGIEDSDDDEEDGLSKDGVL